MVPLDPASRRAFWIGFWMSVLFRYFAFGTLLSLVVGASTLPLNEVTGWIVWTPLVLSGLASPLIVPFLAGFISACFWRRVQWREPKKDTDKALWLSVILGFPFHVLVLGCCLFLTVPIDHACCSSGLERGIKFWNGPLGRQLLGDFSARDDEEERAPSRR